MALAFEMPHGTPPAIGFTRMPFAGTSLGAAQPPLNSDQLSYRRDPLARACCCSLRCAQLVR